MRSRRLSLLAALSALAAMLFTQAAMALALCGAPATAGSAHAHAAKDATHAAPCHEPDQQTNLCASHCHNNDQTLDKPQVKVPVAAPAVGPQLRPVSRSPVRIWAVSRMSALPAGPPPRILFHSFLI